MKKINQIRKMQNKYVRFNIPFINKVSLLIFAINLGIFSVCVKRSLNPLFVKKSLSYGMKILSLKLYLNSWMIIDKLIFPLKLADFL